MKLVYLVTALIAVTALAGCTNPPPAEPTGTPSSVTITRAPESAPANSRVNVCWEVQGTGTIPHTAIHTDTTSHPTATSFNDYKGAAFYPNNASAAAPVAIPGPFCTDVAVGTQTVYYRAHAMGAAPGVLSDERMIVVRSDTNVGALAVTLRSGYNTTAAPNSTVTVCWDVTGQGRIPHTAIHTDNVSRPTAVRFDEYRGQPFYPNNTTAVDPNQYTLPGSFCTGLRMPANGTLYFRAHAMTSAPGVMSTEGNIRVNGSATQQGVVTTVGWQPVPPSTAPRGQNLLVCWRVAGTGTIPHTAVHSDDESHATEPTADFQDYDGPAYYPGNATAANLTGYMVSPTGTVFCTNVMMPADLGDILYLRPHAMDAVTGAPGRLGSPEAVITAS